MKDDKFAETQHGSRSTAKAVSLTPLPEVNKSGVKLLADNNLSIISGLKISVEVIVGSAELTVEELFSLENGTTLALDQLVNAPLKLRLDGNCIATGSLVVVDDNFGIRIDEILASQSLK